MGEFGLLSPLAIFEQDFENCSRADGRTLESFRQLFVKSNLLTSCYGSAFVKSGGTEVIAGLKVY